MIRLYQQGPKQFAPGTHKIAAPEISLIPIRKKAQRDVMAEREDKLYAELVRLADAGLPRPTNQELSYIVGIESEGGGRKYLNALVDRGLISFIPGRTVKKARIIEICASGKKLRVGEKSNQRQRDWA